MNNSVSALVTPNIPRVSPFRRQWFVEQPDGTWDFNGTEFQDHVDAWLDVDGKIDSAQKALASVAASIETKYGEGRIEDFAKSVNRTPRHIRRMAQTWRTFRQIGHWCPDLTFRHHTAALSHPDPVEALNVAQDQNLSSIGLEEWITRRATENADKPVKVKKRAVDSDFREWLDRFDAAILKEWIPSCPDRDFVRRILVGDLRESIADQIHMLDQTAIREKVLEAIEQGALTVGDIRTKANEKVADVSNVVRELIEENLYRWVDEGGMKEGQRGSTRRILHKLEDLCRAGRCTTCQAADKADREAAA